jgi:hypothetical protein
MPNQDCALKGTAATTELWGAVFMMLIFALSARVFHAWQHLAGRPLTVQDAVPVGIDLLICPVPLLMGFAFRKMLRSELDKSSLNRRAYKICNFRIAQILVLAYVTMVL